MTRIEELLATPPAERPRKGPRRWERSANRWCWYRIEWGHEYRWVRRNYEEAAAGWTSTHAGVVAAALDPLSGRLKPSRFRLNMLKEQALLLKDQRVELP